MADKLLYAREPMINWLKDAVPLMEAHWNECGHDHDKIALAPDFPKWTLLERMGCAVGFTARTAESKTLVGYAGYLMAPSLNYRDHTFAFADLVFVTPEHRRGLNGLNFIAHCVAELKKAGASKVQHVSPIDNDFGKLLERLGFVARETVFEKVLV